MVGVSGEALPEHILQILARYQTRLTSSLITVAVIVVNVRPRACRRKRSCLCIG